MWTRRDKHLSLACDGDKLPLEVNAVDRRLEVKADGVRVLSQRIVNQVPAELIPERPDVDVILVINRLVEGIVDVTILSHHCGSCKQESHGATVFWSMQNRHTVHIQCYAQLLFCSLANGVVQIGGPAGFPTL